MSSADKLLSRIETPSQASIVLADILEPNRNNLNLIRLLAALSVIASHVLQLRSGDPAQEILAGTTYYNLGQHAVNVFFVLSGVMVTSSLMRSASLTDFLAARLLRIFPGLVVASMVLSLVLGPAVTTLAIPDYLLDRQTLSYLVKTILLLSGNAGLPGVFADNPVPALANVPIWTIKYELICYALLSILFLAHGLQRPARAISLLLPAAAAIALMFALQDPGRLPNSWDHLARYWLCFSFGVGLFLLRSRVPIRASVLAVLWMAWWISLDTPLERVVSPLTTGYGALCLAAIPVGRLRVLTNRTDLSYGVYIFGWPTLQTILWWQADISTTMLELASIPALLVIAACSWFLVERPCLACRPAAAASIRRSVGWLRGILGRRSATGFGPASPNRSRPWMTRCR